MTRLLNARRWAGAGLLLGVLAVGGCGTGVKLVPAEGVVLINGKPAGNISVQFMPDVLKGGSGPTSSAITDAEGKFRLMSQDGRDGAVVGPHTVILADLEEERPPQGRPMTKPPRLDSKYVTAAGGVPVEVKEGGGTIVVEASGPRK